MTSNGIQIGPMAFGRGERPFVIAEMSGNHNQSLDRALAIVEAAAKSGAHALKIHTYTADTMTLDFEEGEFFISDPNSLWRGKNRCTSSTRRRTHVGVAQADLQSGARAGHDRLQHPL
jgi:sialic acid synthase SpsE